MKPVGKDLRNQHDLPPRLVYMVQTRNSLIFFLACNIFKNKRKFNQLQNSPLGHEWMGEWIMQLIHTVYIVDNEMFQVLVQ